MWSIYDISLVLQDETALEYSDRSAYKLKFGIDEVTKLGSLIGFYEISKYYSIDGHFIRYN